MGAIAATFSNVYLDFQKYAFTHSLLVNASGFAIGVATKEVIQNLLMLVGLPFMKWVGDKLKLVSYVPAVFLKIGWQFVVLMITILFTFLLLEYVVNRGILRMKTVVDSSKFDSYIRSKAEAKTDSIIPITAKEVDKIKKTKQIEDDIVHEAVFANDVDNNRDSFQSYQDLV